MIFLKKKKKVDYDATGFCAKNKDLVWKDLRLLGESSELEIFAALFPAGVVFFSDVGVKLHHKMVV